MGPASFVPIIRRIFDRRLGKAKTRRYEEDSRKRRIRVVRRIARRRPNSRQFNDRFKRISGIAAHSNLQNAINERALIDLTG